MFRKLLQRIRSDDRPYGVYAAIVAQARQPAFYQGVGVADTAEGRFDMIVLHVVLIMRRLRGEGAEGRSRAQALFDLFFDDMDRNLREMGVSDMAVPKRIRSMVEAFYGRAGVYDAALDAAGGEGLEAALERNLFAGACAQSGLDAMAAYVVACEEALAKTSGDALAAGRIDWPAIPASAVEDREGAE
ncbi:ubiquinol-cytochrome C chaperone family protein [Microbaculum sp. FT89]|uniref:ubiquinol-cytochrome C chaperone family protein n=1 Tax=Microbaculum sp. FT89 TaxID=3447298 RepID=UPI003F52A69C